MMDDGWDDYQVAVDQAEAEWQTSLHAWADRRGRDREKTWFLDTGRHAEVLQQLVSVYIELHQLADAEALLELAHFVGVNGKPGRPRDYALEHKLLAIPSGKGAGEALRALAGEYHVAPDTLKRQRARLIRERKDIEERRRAWAQQVLPPTKL
jgi:hypothetical protein